MHFISHRGNLTGINPERENSPEYVQEALDLGYEVEVDVWYHWYSLFWLGHDIARYPVSFELLSHPSVWCHCKNIEALDNLLETDIKCFWHDKENMTITSNKHIWHHSDNFREPCEKSIIVLPELNNVDVSKLVYAGICSDYIADYKRSVLAHV